jgi:hypothetical protein
VLGLGLGVWFFKETSFDSLTNHSPKPNHNSSSNPNPNLEGDGGSLSSGKEGSYKESSLDKERSTRPLSARSRRDTLSDGIKENQKVMVRIGVRGRGIAF